MVGRRRSRRRADGRAARPGEGRGHVGHRPPQGGGRRRDAVHGLRVHQRGHRALRAGGVGLRHRHAPGLVDVERVRVPRVARPLPRSARRRRHHPELRDDRAGGRLLRRHPAADDRGARRRRVGHQREEVVHQPGALREVHDGHRPHRGRRRATAPRVLRHHRPHRHAGLQHRPRGSGVRRDRG